MTAPLGHHFWFLTCSDRARAVLSYCGVSILHKMWSNDSFVSWLPGDQSVLVSKEQWSPTLLDIGRLSISNGACQPCYLGLGRDQVLNKVGQIDQLAISPNGGHAAVLFHTGKDEQSTGGFLFDLETGVLSTSPASPHVWPDSCWSPCSRWLAYVSGTELLVINAGAVNQGNAMVAVQVTVLYHLELCKARPIVNIGSIGELHWQLQWAGNGSALDLLVCQGCAADLQLLVSTKLSFSGRGASL